MIFMRERLLQYTIYFHTKILIHCTATLTHYRKRYGNRSVLEIIFLQKKQMEILCRFVRLCYSSNTCEILPQHPGSRKACDWKTGPQGLLKGLLTLGASYLYRYGTLLKYGSQMGRLNLKTVKTLAVLCSCHTHKKKKIDLIQP